jgi:DNA-binding LytR/AlgR family response regulator
LTENNDTGDFFVKTGGKIERIMYDDLIYVEAMANYITLYTVDKKYIVYLTIKSIQEKLPSGKFIQVHKSYIVNLNKVTAIEGNMLNLGIGKINIGQNFYDNVMNRLLKGKLFKR